MSFLEPFLSAGRGGVPSMILREMGHITCSSPFKFNLTLNDVLSSMRGCARNHDTVCAAYASGRGSLWSPNGIAVLFCVALCLGLPLRKVGHACVSWSRYRVKLSLPASCVTGTTYLLSRPCIL